MVGFEREHPRLFQERFFFQHSDYFDRGHISVYRLPFMCNEMPKRSPPAKLPDYHSNTPWGLYGAGAILVLLVSFVVPWKQLILPFVSRTSYLRRASSTEKLSYGGLEMGSRDYG
jgi:hypothetical protein